MKKMALVVFGIFIFSGVLGSLTTEILLFGEKFDFARAFGRGLGSGIGLFSVGAASLYGLALAFRKNPS